MLDDFKSQTPPDSHEFEDLENAQSAPTPPAQPAQQPQQPQKPQEGFNVKDEVGKAIETATQSIFGPTDPVKIQQRQQEEVRKKQDDQRRIANLKITLNLMAQDDQKLKQQRQQEKQNKAQKEQEEQEVEQEKEMKKQKKEQSFQEQHIRAEQTKAERKGGVGG